MAEKKKIIDFDALAKRKTLRIGGKEYGIQEPSADTFMEYMREFQEEATDYAKNPSQVPVDLIKAIHKVIPEKDLPAEVLRKKSVTTLRDIVGSIYADWQDVEPKNP